MRKGELRCTTLPFPKVQHTGRWVEANVVNPGNSLFGTYLSIWTDGINTYYSNGSTQYVLDNGLWKPKEWDIALDYGGYVWTDGANIYYSYNSTQYVLDNGMWKPKEWNVEIMLGNCIWTDGANIYYSYNSTQYVLDNGEWKTKTWGGLEDIGSFNGSNIWSDGENVYYSYGTNDWILERDTWEPVSLVCSHDIKTSYMWTDGTFVYQSLPPSGLQSVFRGNAWESQTWSQEFKPKDVWTDGKDIYSGSYVLERTQPQALDPSSMLMGWLAGRAVAGHRRKT